MILSIIYLLIIYVDARWDWYNITVNKKYINHLSDALWVAGVYVFIGVVAGFTWMEWREVGVVMIMVPSVRWILLDWILNLSRGLPVDYIGKNSFLDRVLGWMPVDGWIVKIVFLVLSVLLIMIL